MDHCVLTLIAETGLEESLLDWLLDYGHDVMFSSEIVNFHGLEQASLSLSEQVSGHRPMLLVQVQMPLEDARRLCRELAAVFTQAHIHYRIAPLTEAGPLSACRPQSDR